MRPRCGWPLQQADLRQGKARIPIRRSVRSSWTVTGQVVGVGATQRTGSRARGGDGAAPGGATGGWRNRGSNPGTLQPRRQDTAVCRRADRMRVIASVVYAVSRPESDCGRGRGAVGRGRRGRHRRCAGRSGHGRPAARMAAQAAHGPAPRDVEISPPASMAAARPRTARANGSPATPPEPMCTVGAQLPTRSWWAPARCSSTIQR